jgi:hypothetical protein
MTRFAWGVAVVLTLWLSADAEAWGRGGRRQCCSSCYPMPVCTTPSCDSWYAQQACSVFGQVPNWVRRLAVDHKYGVPKCPQGYTCYCCQGLEWIACGDGSNCDAGTMGCSMGPPTFSCPGGANPAAYHSDPQLYAMVCDRCFHKMRFALPYETPDGYFLLWALGRDCGCPTCH